MSVSAARSAGELAEAVAKGIPRRQPAWNFDARPSWAQVDEARDALADLRALAERGERIEAAAKQLVRRDLDLAEVEKAEQALLAELYPDVFAPSAQPAPEPERGEAE